MTAELAVLDPDPFEAHFPSMHPQLPTPILESLKASTRRRFLQHCGTGMGALALGTLSIHRCRQRDLIQVRL